MMKKILILAAVLSLGGCIPHSKDLDSYNTLFRNDEVTPPQKGDPFTFGGMAEGSGGTIARQSYATDNVSANPLNATETGRLGEIAADRGPTAGALPGGGPPLPGTGAPKAAAGATHSTAAPTSPATARSNRATQAITRSQLPKSSGAPGGVPTGAR